MGERTGPGLVEQLVLDTMAQVGATPDRPYMKSARIVEAVEATHGIHPDYAYAAMVSLAADWLIPIRLVDNHGNLGSVDYGPADAAYTEARLTVAGLLAVESERADLPKLPLSLINGDMYAGGHAPSFEPSLVLDALTRAIEYPRLDDEDFAAVIGWPAFPTRCAVGGELAALRAGEPARLRLSARVSAESAPRRTVVVTDLPLGVGPNEIIESIKWRSKSLVDPERYEELAQKTTLPIRDVNDESMGDKTRIVCLLADGADERSTIDQLLDVWPVSIERTAQLAAPLGTLIRRAVDVDRWAQLDAITRLRAAVDGQRPTRR